VTFRDEWVQGPALFQMCIVVLPPFVTWSV